MIQRLIAVTLVGTLLWSAFGGSLKAKTLEITTIKEFEKACSQEKPLILFFYAPWCGACKGMKEPYDNIAKDRKDVVMAKISVENKKLKGLFDAFNITVIPTIITRQTGMLSQEQLETMVTRKPRVKPVKAGSAAAA